MSAVGWMLAVGEMDGMREGVLGPGERTLARGESSGRPRLRADDLENARVREWIGGAGGAGTEIQFPEAFRVRSVRGEDIGPLTVLAAEQDEQVGPGELGLACEVEHVEGRFVR